MLHFPTPALSCAQNAWLAYSVGDTQELEKVCPFGYLFQVPQKASHQYRNVCFLLSGNHSLQGGAG